MSQSTLEVKCAISAIISIAFIAVNAKLTGIFMNSLVTSLSKKARPIVLNGANTTTGSLNLLFIMVLICFLSMFCFSFKLCLGGMSAS